MKPPRPLPRLEQLRRQRPECEPWLALVGCVIRAIDDAEWVCMLPAEPPAGRGAGDVPLLSGAALGVDVGLLRRHVDRLLARAGPAGTAARRALMETHAVALLVGAANQDARAVARVASGLGADATVLRAVAPLVALPVLHACRVAWQARVSPEWARPWCPICGAWPAIAEVRGLDRTRRYRCLPCGSEWAGAWLACPYCGNGDHTQLGALVSAGSPETRKAETCKRCLGYLKSVATLQGCPASELPLLDLETVELDLAAVENGYRRPEGVGHRLDLRVEPTRRRLRGLVAWTR